MDHNDLSFSANNLNSGSNLSLLDPNQSVDNTNGFKSNKLASTFDSFAFPLLPDGLDALNNMPIISCDQLNGELALSAESDGGSFYPSVSQGKSLNVGKATDASSDGINSLDPILQYISQMLMEENMEEKVWTGPDNFALQNTEKSFYDALGEQYPGLPDNFQNFDARQFIWSQDSSLPGRNSKKISVAAADIAANSSSMSGNGSIKRSVFNDNEYVLHFKRVSEEAKRFLPSSNQLVINFDNACSGSQFKRGIVEVDVHKNNGDREDTLCGSRGRKNPEREDLGLVEARATKQMASHVEVEEDELSEMFDKVLLCTQKAEPLRPTNGCLSIDASKDLQTTASLHGSNGGRVDGRRRASNSSVDLRALLILCAQALSSNDLRTATELLKQIRENSSPSGDGSQRLAHYFANGLEACLARNNCRTQSYHALIASKKISMADALKATQLHFSSCPFWRLYIFYENCLIQKLSQKATNIHIIDFGIGPGFKWPILIQKLGEQVGGPPLLRITGIELPQPGLRPAQTIDETGRRLARYCERFNVPFEFNALPSRNWVAIKIEDLKIHSDETVVVSSFSRFDILPETVDDDSQKDAMLDLIRRIKPNVFVHVVTNGSYNSPFFVTRFREALLHWSSIYDMLDTTISGEHKNSKERRFWESDFCGRTVMNVVACEGPERVGRPETYKQWQARRGRAGFKQYPLDRAMMKRFRRKLKAWYHKEFVLDEDGEWMLMGWKGRILTATTSWVPM